MTSLFNFFAGMILIIGVTGGVYLKAPHLQLDLATLDVWAIIALLIVAFSKGKVLKTSRFTRLLETESENTYSRFSAFALFIFSGIMLIAHILKHWALKTDGYDVSFVHQSLFNPFGPPFFPADISRSGTALGEHLLFTLVPVSLITQFIRSDEFVFLIQTLALTLPVYFLIKNGPLKNLYKLQAAATVIVLASRPLRNAIIFDFREDTFIFVGLIGMILSLLHRRTVLYFSFLTIALLSKENAFLVMPFFIAPLMLAKNIDFSKKTRIQMAVTTALIALVYGILAFKFLIPLWNSGSGKTSQIAERLSQFGSTPEEILRTIILSPVAWWILIQNFFTKQALLYIGKMLLPLVPFLIYREVWIWIIPGLAAMAMNIASGHHGQTSMMFHYDLIVLPCLFMGGLIGLKKIDTHSNQKLVVCVLLALCVSDKWPMFHLRDNIPDAESISARKAFLALDREKPVIVNSHFSAQLTQHRKLFILSPVCSKSQISGAPDFKGYLVFDRSAGIPDCEEGNIRPVYQNTKISILEKF